MRRSGFRAAAWAAVVLLAAATAAPAADEPAAEAEAASEAPAERRPDPGAPPSGGQPTGDDGMFYEYDPLERMNRGVFWFNEKADTYVLEPVARAWNWALPDPVQRSVSNFFWHIRVPIYLANDLLQWKPKQAGVDVARFFINTTVGVLGFMDPAGDRWGLTSDYEDTGQTLGVWGLGPGPYLVLPLLGPSSLRDGTGLVADGFMAISPFFIDTYILLGSQVVHAVNTRSLYLIEIANAKATSFDYYSFVRSSYLQRRKKLVADSETGISKEEAQELYYPEE